MLSKHNSYRIQCNIYITKYPIESILNKIQPYLSQFHENPLYDKHFWRETFRRRLQTYRSHETIRTKRTVSTLNATILGYDNFYCRNAARNIAIVISAQLHVFKIEYDISYSSPQRFINYPLMHPIYKKFRRKYKFIRRYVPLIPFVSL